MRLDPDFSEFIGLLNEHEVDYLVVGGHAVALHGHPRYTGDMDVWLRTDVANAERVLAALEDFGFGGLDITREDLLEPDQVVQLGYSPLRLDLMTSLSGVAFEECHKRRVEVEVAGLTVPFISLQDLRRNKRASGRIQDLADLEALDGLAG